MKIYLVLVICMFLSTALVSEPVTVGKVNLEKYLGFWYEIARIPNRFQKKCDKNVSAQYSYLTNGDVKVLNRCIEKDGSSTEVEGIAKVVDKVSSSKLKVSFVKFLGMNLFYGDYWIYGLAEDYSWALVGSPNLKYGWILSRSPDIMPETLNKIYELMIEVGFDKTKFVMTDQDEGRS